MIFTGSRRSGAFMVKPALASLGPRAASNPRPPRYGDSSNRCVDRIAVHRSGVRVVVLARTGEFFTDWRYEASSPYITLAEALHQCRRQLGDGQSKV